MTLRAEVVDLLGVDQAEDAIQRRRVVEIAVVKNQPAILFVRVLIDLIDARGVERRRASDDAVNFVAFLEEKLGEIGAVLARDAGDQRALHGLRSHNARTSVRWNDV